MPGSPMPKTITQNQVVPLPRRSSSVYHPARRVPLPECGLSLRIIDHLEVGGFLASICRVACREILATRHRMTQRNQQFRQQMSGMWGFLQEKRASEESTLCATRYNRCLMCCYYAGVLRIVRILRGAARARREGPLPMLGARHCAQNNR